jgi:hypothetical protein
MEAYKPTLLIFIGGILILILHEDYEAGTSC